MTSRLVCAIAALAVLAGTNAFAAAPQTNRQALAILRSAVDAPRHVSFTAQVELLTIGSQSSEASVFRVAHSASGLTRRTYVSPPNLYGDWSVSRGDSTYSVDVKRHRIVVTENETFGIHYGWERNLALLTRNYNAVLGPPGHVIGRTTHTIALVNRYTGATAMRLWIDDATGLMLQREVYTSSGSLVIQMHFDDLNVTRAIPPSTFTLPHYPIVQGPSRGVPSIDPSVVIARCGFRARVPRYLPEGFTDVAADLARENGIETLHILYSDGLRTVSLFENARGSAVDMSGYHVTAFSAGPLRGQYVDSGAFTLLAWARGGLHFALVGDLNRNDLEKIALSLV